MYIAGIHFLRIIGAMIIFLVTLVYVEFFLGPFFINYYWLKEKINKISSSGESLLFTQVFFDNMFFKFKFFLIAVVVLSVVMLLLRSKIKHYFSRVYRDFIDINNFFYSIIKKSIAKDSMAYRCTFGIVLIFSCAIRLYYLNAPLRYDEAFTYNNYASKSLLIALSNYSAPNNHLFHTLLAHISTSLLGDGEWAIRLPAFFAGILLLISVYTFFRMIHGKYLAVVTLGLIGHNSYFIEYSTSARGYVFVGLFFFCIMIFVELLRKRQNEFLWFMIAVFAALGLYAIPTMVYCLGVVIAWAIIPLALERPRDWKKITHFSGKLATYLVLGGVITIVLYAPIFVTGFGSYSSKILLEKLPIDIVIRDLPQAISAIGLLWTRAMPDWARLVCSILVALGVFVGNKSLKNNFLLFCSILLPSLVIILVQRKIPFTRNWFFLFPVFAGFISMGIMLFLERLKEKKGYDFFIIAVVLMVFIPWMIFEWKQRSILSLSEDKTLLAAKEVSLYLRPLLSSEDRVMAKCPADAPLEYYFGRYNIPKKGLIVPKATPRNIYLVQRKEQSIEAIFIANQEKGLLPGESLRAIYEAKDAIVYKVVNENL
ncbi:MAG: glycosyltransferase family 39 protein [Oligoflexia bacterium]|nr:glycosyltransferase family 39 protein [Oligoflexia bacterium]